MRPLDIRRNNRSGKKIASKIIALHDSPLVGELEEVSGFQRFFSVDCNDALIRKEPFRNDRAPFVRIRLQRVSFGRGEINDR